MKKIVSIVVAALALIFVAYALFTEETTTQTVDESFYNSPQETTQIQQQEIDFQNNTTEQQGTAYSFRNERLLQQHYEKHGKEMGFPDAESYEKAASDVINNKNALHKIEKEDGDDVYYIVSTNELVVLSTDGYIRTYFKPNAGKRYFDRT